jgi:hypothetical protein
MPKYRINFYTYTSAYDIGPVAVKMFADARPKNDGEAIGAAKACAAFLCNTLQKVEVNLLDGDRLVDKWIAFPPVAPA